MDSRTLSRSFYTRNTLLVARELLGKYLVHRLPEGIVAGRIVETEAYAGIYDPASHTYKNHQTARTQIWYGEGGYAYVYQIYGSYVCLGIITEQEGIPGAVLIRALEPTDGIEWLSGKLASADAEPGLIARCCAGPSKLCLAMRIEKQCNHLDLCGQQLYLEERDAPPPLEEVVYAPRINIDYAGAGALSAWRYYLRSSPAISRRTYEPLRAWRRQGYPGLQQVRTHTQLDLLSALTQQEATTMMQEETITRVRNLPKVELHLHLEGCMTPATLRRLAAQNRKPLPAHLVQGETRFFTTFDEFAHLYYSVCQVLVHEQDFRSVIDDLADYLRRNQVVYCEVAWTPFLYLNRGLRFEAIMAVMQEALSNHGLADRVNFLIDVQRDHGLEAATQVYERVLAARNPHIVGIGLTGQEEGFPPSVFAELYRRAKEAGLGCTAHAGEYGSAQDIWQCVRDLEVSRIGHGIRAIYDRELLDVLAEHAIHLEVCPSSNVLLGRVLSYASHPVRTLWEHHISLGLNSDDPGLFGLSITDEYLKVLAHCGFSLADLHQMVKQSIIASFASPSHKRALEQHIDSSWRQEHAGEH